MPFASTLLVAFAMLAIGCRPPQSGLTTASQSKANLPDTVARVVEASMVPALLGAHSRVRCENCGAVYAIEPTLADEPDLRSTCEACGAQHVADVLDSRPGQSVDLQAIGPPDTLRRWDIVAARRQDRLYVKRLVGMPTDRVQLRNGDVWVNDQIARKSLKQFRAVAVTVADTKPMQQLKLAPVWRSPLGKWGVVNGRFRTPANQREHAADALDWLNFTGRQIVGRQPTTSLVWDDLVFNRSLSRTLNPVDDVTLDCTFHGDLLARARWGDGVWQLTCTMAGRLQLAQLGEGNVVQRRLAALSAMPAQTRSVQFGRLDRQIVVGIDWQPLIVLPLDKERRRLEHGLLELAVSCVPAASLAQASPVPLVVHRLRVLRDLHYEAVASGVGYKPFSIKLKTGEVLLLGDNTGVSEDGRHWGATPIADLEGTIISGVN